MNPLAPYLGIIKIIAILALVSGLVAVYFAWHHNIFEQGVTQEGGRRDKLDADNMIKAQEILGKANEAVRITQASLNEAILKIANNQTELKNAKIKSAALESDLRSGAKRMSVLIASRQNGTAGQPTDSAAANMDQGAEAIADLSPAVAAGLVELAAEGDAAIARLNACVEAYEAVEHAVNSVAP